MAKIYSYRKVTDDWTTYYLRGEGITELCEIEGITYCTVPDEIDITNQSPKIIDSVQLVVLDDVLREKIKAVSPHVALISQRMIDTIRSSYSIDDEMFFARIGVSMSTGLYTPTAGEMNEMMVFGTFVEGVREWGRNEKALLGL